METWLIPFSIISGVGLLILSTVNLSTSLSTEIATMIKADAKNPFIGKKIAQLKKLNLTLVSLYLAAMSYVLSAIVMGSTHSTHIGKLLLLSGTFFFFTTLILLIIYGFRMVRIKSEQFQQ